MLNLSNLPKKDRTIIIAGLSAIILIFCSGIVYFFWPMIDYYISPKQDVTNYLNIKDSKDRENSIIIPKIDVDMPIVEGPDESALNRGAWLMPDTSYPDKGGNTVITGHRFKYKPPHKETFYLLDKLAIGDIFRIFWQGKKYDYKIVWIKVVEPDDLSVLEQTKDPVATLITCHPLFSTAKRLIVRGEKI